MAETDTSDSRFVRYVVFLSTPDGVATPRAAILEHVRFLDRLSEAGVLEAAGPFESGGVGMLILRAESLAAARAWAGQDPFVLGGFRELEIRTWLLSTPENLHLGIVAGDS